MILYELIVNFIGLVAFSWFVLLSRWRGPRDRVGPGLTIRCAGLGSDADTQQWYQSDRHDSIVESISNKSYSEFHVEF